MTGFVTDLRTDKVNLGVTSPFKNFKSDISSVSYCYLHVRFKFNSCILLAAVSYDNDVSRRGLPRGAELSRRLHEHCS